MIAKFMNFYHDGHRYFLDLDFIINGETQLALSRVIFDTEPTTNELIDRANLIASNLNSDITLNEVYLNGEIIIYS